MCFSPFCVLLPFPEYDALISYSLLAQEDAARPGQMKSYSPQLGGLTFLRIPRSRSFLSRSFLVHQAFPYPPTTHFSSYGPETFFARCFSFTLAWFFLPRPALSRPVPFWCQCLVSALPSTLRPSPPAPYLFFMFCGVLLGVFNVRTLDSFDSF